MAKKKKKRPLVSAPVGTVLPEYESYNPLLENDSRTSRRFSIGVAASVGFNVLFFGMAAYVAAQVNPPTAEEKAIEVVYDNTPPTLEKQKPEPKEKPTPPPPQPKQVAQVEPQTEVMPKPEREKPTPKPEKEKPTPEPKEKPTPEPEKVKPTPPPTEVHTPPPPPPTQVAMVKPQPPEVTPPPVKLEQQKPVTSTAETVTPEKATTIERTTPAEARQATQVHTATTEALQAKVADGSTNVVMAPTSHPVHGPTGAMSTAMGPRSQHQLAELSTPAFNHAGGGAPNAEAPSESPSHAGGQSMSARAMSAVSASNDNSSIAAQTASAGVASVMSNTPTRSITMPLTATGPRMARTKVLTALGATAPDPNNFSVQQGGVVTAGQVVGTQGSTSARVAQVATAGGAPEAMIVGVSNGIMSNNGGQVISGPRVAVGAPGLTGPRQRMVGTQVAMGSAYGAAGGAPGSVNVAAVGSGGGAGGGVGGGQARGAAGIGSGFGSGSSLHAQSSGTDGVVSSQHGHPANGPVAASGAAFGPTTTRSSRVSTTSIGDAAGPSGPAGGPEGTSAGQGRAGNSTGRSGSVDGAASGGAVGFKEGSGGSSTIASSGGSRTESARTDGAGGPTTTGSQIGRSQNAQIVRKVTPSVPDSMRSQQFTASIDATFTIHKDGSFDVEITKGSGNDQIDRIAKTALRSWKWKPAIANNQPTESTQTVHVELSVN